MRKFSLFMLMAVGLLISGNAGAVDVSTAEGLKSALSEAPDGVETTITLTGNIDVVNDQASVMGGIFTIGANKNIVLDLNGNHIECKNNATTAQGLYFIDNQGELTIKDSQSGGYIKLYGTSNAGKAEDVIHTTNTLTIQGGKIENALANSNWTAYVVDMRDTPTDKGNIVNIEGGELIQSAYVAPVVRMYGRDVSTQTTSYTVNMTGGKVSGERGFYISQKSNTPFTITISGGEIEAKKAGNDYRVIDSQQENNDNVELANVKITISGSPIIKGYLCLSNVQGNKLVQKNVEDITISGGNFVTNNGVQFGEHATKKAEKFISGGTFFFEQTEVLQTVIPYILFDQHDAKGDYACTNDLIYARYTDALASMQGWKDLGYVVTKVGDNLFEKTGEWYKVEKKVKSDAAFADFKKLIADGYTAVDITGKDNGDGGTWAEKTVIVKQVETKEITTETTLNPTDVTETDAVVIKSNVTIGSDNAEQTFKVYSLNVEEGGSLTIGSKATVIVGDGGFGNNQTTINVTINANGESSGIVKVSPDAPRKKQKVRVNLYTKAHSKYEGSTIKASYWQLFARPTEMEVESFGVVSNPESGVRPLITNIYGYDGNHWVPFRSLDELDNKFEGYAISNNTENGGVVYQFTGWMCLNDDAELKFNHGGFTLMGNSYLAPMSILSIFEQMPKQSSETASTENTIWYYESEDGSYKQVTRLMYELEDSYRYKQVEPMQGFFMYLNGSSLNATLSYADAVWNQTLEAHPLPAPGLGAKGMNMAKITVSADGKNDEMRVYEDNDFSPAFDNGADATKMMNLDGMFNLYVATEGKNYANFATDNLEGTILTFNANAQREYTLSFSNANIDYQLVDLLTGEKIEMTEGNTYTFMAEPNSTVERFQIVPAAMAPTAIKNTKSAVANKVMKNGMLLIERNNQIYTVQGQNVK